MDAPDISGTISEDQVGDAFRKILGMEPRSADVSVVMTLGGTRAALAEYIWDHWFGEPDHPSLEEVQIEVDVAIGEISSDPSQSS